MTPLEQALAYVELYGWPVFPRPGGRWVGHGYKDASRDPRQIREWWTRWPRALIAMPTGKPSGVVTLDADAKGGNNGFDTLAKLGKSALPVTPMVHTPHAGLHLHFAVNLRITIRCSQGELGPGLDVKGEGGAIALPTPGWNYRWDPHYHPGNTPFLTAPAWFAHRRKRSHDRSSRNGVLQPDPAKILTNACRIIRDAVNGERHEAINRQAFIVGLLVARNALDEFTARHELEAAATAMLWGAGGNPKKTAHDLADAFHAGIAKGRHR